MAAVKEKIFFLAREPLGSQNMTSSKVAKTSKFDKIVLTNSPITFKLQNLEASFRFYFKDKYITLELMVPLIFVIIRSKVIFLGQKFNDQYLKNQFFLNF